MILELLIFSGCNNPYVQVDGEREAGIQTKFEEARRKAMANPETLEYHRSRLGYAGFFLENAEGCTFVYDGLIKELKGDQETVYRDTEDLEKYLAEVFASIDPTWFEALAANRTHP